MSKTLASLPHLSLRDVLERAIGKEDMMTRDDLSRRLGIHVSTLDQWKAGKRLPREDVMLSLCGMARLEPMEGLALLNIWRSEGRVRETYIKMLHRLDHHYILRQGQDIAETGITAPTVKKPHKTSGEQIHMK